MSEFSVKVNNYWRLEHDVARGYNRLKAKLFNLIEASVTDKSQSEAIKGLIRGFANDEYAQCINNMRYTAEDAGYIEKGQGVPSASLDGYEATAA